MGAGIPARKDLELKHVLLFFRHGDRSPISTSIGTKLYTDEQERDFWIKKLPTDEQYARAKAIAKVTGMEKDQEPTREPRMGGKWPHGQLTKNGFEEMEARGAAARKRYQDFLGEECNPLDIYIRSTNMERTILSARCFLLGMFPELSAGAEPLLHIRTKEPFTLSPVYKNIDFFTVVDELNRSGKSPVDLKQLEERVREHAGIHPEKNVEWTAVREVLVCREAHGVDLPPGFDQQVVKDVCKHNAWEWNTMYADPERAKLAFGDAIKEIYSILDGMTKDDSSHKVTLMAAHDSSLAAFFGSLGIDTGGLVPHYGSTVTIELLQHRKTKEYYVEIFFDNEPLTVLDHGHSSLMSMKHLTKIVKPFLEMKTIEQSVDDESPFSPPSQKSDSAVMTETVNKSKM